MSKTFLETFCSITLWIEENTGSHPLHIPVGQALRFFIFTPKCSDNLCKAEFSSFFLFVPKGINCGVYLAFKTG